MSDKRQCDPERQRIINDAARIKNDIDQYFCDVDFWNNDTRVRLYPNDAPIEADEDGLMARMRAGMVRTLEHEASLGFHPTVTYPPVTPSKYIALTDTTQLRRKLQKGVDNENQN